MKKFIVFFTLTIIIFNLIVSQQAHALNRPSDMRGIWISSVYNLDFPSTSSLSAKEQQIEIESILNTVEKSGLNTVFFQVRPCCDALYPSEIFPWSAYLTGTQGNQNDENFDPLAFMIKEGHKRGIRIHAWINPLRVTTGTKENPCHDLSALSKENPARKHPEYTVAFEDGKIYWDPGFPQVRELICDGVAEIVRNYDIDGIVFDDYFYPQKTTINGETVDFNDSVSYEKYAGKEELSQWRRDNITTLISDVYQTIKEIKSNALFGVSPFGVWADKEKSEEGSDTCGGLSSCFDQYADSKKWVENKILDYIVPQVYWNIGYESTDFEKLLTWWENICKDSGVSLYIGHALYKVGDNSQSDVWLDPDEITRQLTLVKESTVAKGSIFYGYSNLKTNTLSAADHIEDFYQNVFTPETILMPEAPEDKGIIIASPKDGYQTGYNAVSILGSADPAHPLYLNNKKVDMTENGHFAVYIDLEAGINTLDFSQNGKQNTLTVEKTTSKTTAFYFNGQIAPDFVSPQNKTIKAVSGYCIPLSCIAPRCSRVSVTIGDASVLLYPDFENCPFPSSTGILLYSIGCLPPITTEMLSNTVFHGSFTFPTCDSLSDLGMLVFTIQSGGTNQKIAAGTSLYTFPEGFFTGSFKDGHSKISANTTSPYSLSVAGANDSVLYDDGENCILSSGFMVAKDAIEIFENEKISKNYISSIIFSQKEHSVHTSFKVSSPPLCTISYDKKSLTLSFYHTNTRFFPKFKNELISGVKYRNYQGGGEYTYEFNSPISGYSYQYEDGIFEFQINMPKSQSVLDKTIVLDAGHGGDSPGALGPMGVFGPNEKDITLAIAQYTKAYLENLGATVILTRDQDEALGLYERVERVQANNPDLMISLHSNAVLPNVNYLERTGIFTFYSSDLSQDAADYITDALSSKIAMKNNGALYQSLALCRLTCCPCVLLELGFMSNPNDFEMLSNPDRQKEMASALSDTICDYFGNSNP